MSKLLNLIYERSLNMMVFATLFILLGYLIPRIYYTYFDTTQYYTINNPVQTDKQVYHHGEEITLYFDRTSLINVSATAFLELVLIAGDTKTEIATFRRPLSLDNNPPYQRIATTLKIDNNLPCGTYYIRGTVYFRYQELDKNVSFYTKEFEIVKL